MAQYLIRRSAAALIALVLASIFVFLGVRALPGDPALVSAGVQQDVSEETLAAIRAKYGTDQPLPVQYARWITLALQGDLGRSYFYGQEVMVVLARTVPVTLYLALLSVGFAVLIGVTTGVIASVKRGTWIDSAANFVAVAGLSIPNFWLGLMLILIFAVTLGWLPASGYVPLFESPVESLRRMVMPAVVLGTGLSAVLMRQTRSSMTDTLTSDYVRTARAKGLGEIVVVGKHALRNSLITVTTLIGLQLGAILAGAVVTERVFLIPGYGDLVVRSVTVRDYTLIQGITLVSAFAYILINWLVDVAYSVLNPKIRVSGRAS